MNAYYGVKQSVNDMKYSHTVILHHNLCCFTCHFWGQPYCFDRQRLPKTRKPILRLSETDQNLNHQANQVFRLIFTYLACTSSNIFNLEGLERYQLIEKFNRKASIYKWKYTPAYTCVCVSKNRQSSSAHLADTGQFLCSGYLHWSRPPTP